MLLASRQFFPIVPYHARSGWTVPNKGGSKVPFNLESTPLDIKTNSELGSGEEVRMWLSTANNLGAGGIKLLFSFPPQYLLENCQSSNSYANFPVALPLEVQKVWTIFLTKNQGIRLEIHCNEVEVLNFLMSDKTCTQTAWFDLWSRDAGKLYFGSKDTASDYYRKGLIIM